MENKDTRLIYVYDSNGTLVNGKPFVGFNSVFDYIDASEGLIDLMASLKRYNQIRMQCRPNGDMIGGYYFRTRPTTVFKSKVKFYSLKLKV
jgi:hypothetical protein